MPWILLDLALVVVSVAVLGLLLLGLWRRIKALGAVVARASELVEGSSGALQVERRAPEPVRRP